MISPSHILDHSKSFFTEKLVSSASLNELAFLSQQLPNVFHIIYYEIRSNDDPRVDLIGMASASTVAKLPQDDRTEFFYGAKKRAFQDWVTEKEVPMVSVEYDLIDQKVENVLLFWSIYKGYHFSNTVVSLNREDKRKQNEVMISKALSYEGYVIKEHTWTAVANCLDCFPSSAEVLHVLNMRDRGIEGIRMIFVIHLEDIIPFFTSLKWKGNLALLQQLVDIIRPFHFNTSFQLTFTEHLEPTIGFEVYPSEQVNIERNRIELTSFFDQLRAENIFDSEKTPDVLNWLGSEKIQEVEKNWPMMIVRDVNTKFVIGEGAQAEVKFYLGCNASYTLF